MTGFNLGSGGTSVSFKHPGAMGKGTVLDMQEVQQTDFKTSKPLFWDDGNPRMQYKITLQTEERNPENPSDDGKRELYVKGSRQPRQDGTMGSLCAVLEAIKAAGGGTELKYGAQLAVQWTSGSGETGDPKGYQAWYVPPAFDMQQPSEHRAPAPQQQAPQQAQQQPQQGFQGQQPTQQPQGNPFGQQQPQQPAQQGFPPQGQPSAAVQAANPFASPPPQQAQQQAQQGWGQQPAQQPAQQPTGPAPWDQPQAQGNPFAQQQPQQGFPGQQAPQQPAQQQLPGTGAPGGPTQEQIAGLQAAGIDPAQVYGPGWQQQLQPAGQ